MERMTDRFTRTLSQDTAYCRVRRAQRKHQREIDDKNNFLDVIIANAPFMILVVAISIELAKF